MDEEGSPQVGDVLLTEAVVFADGDHAHRRPVVVMRAPRSHLDYVTVIQRSSTADTLDGVDHPKDPGLGLDRDGRWVLKYQRAIRCDQLLEASSYLGRLDREFLDPLVELWEAS